MKVPFRNTDVKLGFEMHNLQLGLSKENFLSASKSLLGSKSLPFRLNAPGFSEQTGFESFFFFFKLEGQCEMIN